MCVGRCKIPMVVPVDIMTGIIGKLYVRLSGLQGRMANHLHPLLEEHKCDCDDHDDMLTWVNEAAPSGRQSVEDIALCMLNVNFTALHTTAMTFTHVVLHLASKPEYIDILRSEIEDAANGNPLDQAALERCWKLDSFLKESQRLNGLGAREPVPAL
ncbi:cytochrome P450 [Desarmillaria tabescens]|uniref:Cytochrome P450 n=1 Tax=Armillaria tabescens TaxID=1929756 RepID=A0AA39KC75_ARMTA|nr:cytochrome P450 [Desarmillaria tabescens]KAK0458307.1 cytochrome P450 [Desarmillaria tabescens]